MIPARPIDPLTSLGTPNQKIVGQLEEILNLDRLKAKFQPLPSKETHINKTEWSKAYGFGALALGMLAAHIYKQGNQQAAKYKYAAIGLGFAAVVSLAKSCRIVRVPTEAYKQQCEEIKTIFKGVAKELRKVWYVASELITSVNNERPYKSIQEANDATTELLKTYYRSEWSDNGDPFTELETKALSNEKAEILKAQRPWRAAYTSLRDRVVDITELNLDDLKHDKELHPVIFKKLVKLHYEAVRMIYGVSPARVGQPYVHNSISESIEGKIQVESNPWFASPWPAKKV